MEKKICIIGAVSQNGVYGSKGGIPWTIPEELKHFAQKTKGTTVVMGRATWESLPKNYQPLPNRENYSTYTLFKFSGQRRAVLGITR